MSSTNAVSIELDSDLIAEIDALAAADGHTRSDLVGEVMRAYLAHRTAFAAAVQEGLDDYHAGDLRTHDQVMASVDALLARYR